MTRELTRPKNRLLHADPSPLRSSAVRRYVLPMFAMRPMLQVSDSVRVAVPSTAVGNQTPTDGVRQSSGATITVIPPISSSSAPQANTLAPSKEPFWWLEHTRDVFQIGFFAVVGIVTILTYRKARLTLLQPLRTEVFKEQLKVFSELLPMFVGRTESELRDDFDFDHYFTANTFALYDDYARTFFDIEVDREKRPYSSTECPSSIINIEDFVNSFTLVDGHTRQETLNTDAPSNDPRTRAARWHHHKHSELRIPSRMMDQQAKLTRLMGSPLVPAELLRLLDEYKATVDKNVLHLGELLTVAAGEMPEKYPDQNSLARAAFDWISTRWIRDFEELEPKAKQIAEYLRNYFQTDTLLRPS